MPNRHLSRTIAMQTLYEWDFQKKRDLKEIIERNIKAFEKEEVDKDYINVVVEGVTKKMDELDKKIQEAATEWPLDQIPILDKTILRLSTYELLFMDDIPPKVAINEAVELAKTFGSENTSKFVNGVLGTLYRTSERYVPDEGDVKRKWAQLQNKIKKSQNEEEDKD